jgi:uncharacterized protein
MANQILIDSGPLVAFLSSNEKYHRWVLEQMSDMNGDLVTTESVLSEVVFLMKHHHTALNAVHTLINQGLLQILPAFSESPSECVESVLKYADLPSSVADISLVYLYSTIKNSVIFTLDSDFLVYKDKYGNPLRLVAPFE